MYVELWDLIGRKYTDPEDDEYAMLVSKDGVHIANAVEILFSKAKGEGRIREYNIEIPLRFRYNRHRNGLCVDCLLD